MYQACQRFADMLAGTLQQFDGKDIVVLRCPDNGFESYIFCPLGDGGCFPGFYCLTGGFYNRPACSHRLQTAGLAAITQFFCSRYADVTEFTPPSL